MKRVSLIFFLSLLITTISVNAISGENSYGNSENSFENISMNAGEEIENYIRYEKAMSAYPTIIITNINSETGDISSNERDSIQIEEPITTNTNVENDMFMGPNEYPINTESHITNGRVLREKMITPIENRIAPIETLSEVKPVNHAFYIKAPNTGRK